MINFPNRKLSGDAEQPSAEDQRTQAIEEELQNRSQSDQQRAHNPVSSTFSQFFSAENEASEQSSAASNTNGHLYQSNTIEAKMEKNIKELRAQYTMGGIKSSRFITTEILMEAPKDYFDKFNAITQETVSAVQTQISETGKSDLIGLSQNNPTDEELQDQAYRVIHSISSAYLERKMFTQLERNIIMNLVCSEIIGFSRIDPLWRDQRIDEIMCNGPFDVQIEVGGQIYRVPSCRFRDQKHLSTLIDRLYGAIGKPVTPSTSLVKGRLHDNSRMYATHQVLCPSGPNFNIRRHHDDFIGPEQLLEWGTAEKAMMTEIGNLVYKGASFIIMGGTSSGKTTLLAALSAFIPPDARVVSLEDNLELKLHPNKLCAAPMECLPPRPDKPNDSGVNMRELVKASLQMRPNGIIIGEVTDGSCYDLAQALNTGHWGFSTIHANSERDGIYRLMSLVSQGGIMTNEATLPLIAAAFDFIIQVVRFPEDGRRRIVGLSEVSPFPVRNQHNELTLPTTPIWQFESQAVRNHQIIGEWKRVNNISETRRNKLRLDLEPPLTWEQLENITKIVKE